jgi:adenylate cyclase
VLQLSDEERRRPASALDAATATFLFADIAGYTALTEAHGDEQAADLVAEFFKAVSEELPTRGGRHVKTIGDALMLRIPDPAQAVQLGLHITHELLRGHGAPAVRVGLHHGAAIERDGDYFGATVNLAARVAAVAIGGEVLLTAQTAALAPVLEGIFYQPRGRQTLRNIREPVELFAAIPQGQPFHANLPVDPVCQMAVDPERAAGRLTFENTAYFFCTLACAAEFASHPERFIG